MFLFCADLAFNGCKVLLDFDLLAIQVLLIVFDYEVIHLRAIIILFLIIVVVLLLLLF